MANKTNEKTQESKMSPYFVWGLLVLFFVYQYIARSAFSTVLTEQYKGYFGLDSAGVGTLVSCYYILYALMQIPAGVLIDRVNLRFIVTIASAACSGGLLLFVSTPNATIASIGQMLIGFGSAFAFLCVLKACISMFPPEKQALMMTVSISIGCMGPVVGGPVVATLAKSIDWRSIILVFSLIGFVLTAVLWTLLGNIEEGEAKGNTDSTHKFGVCESLKIIVSSPQAWIMAIFAFMQYVPLSALADLWGTSYIKQLYNADTAVCSLASNMMYLGIIIGGPLFSMFALYIDSYKKSMLIAVIGTVIAFAVVLFGGHYVPLYGTFILLFIVGFCTSAMFQFTLGALLLPKEVSGTLSGFINMGSMFSGVVFMPLIGYLIDKSWDGTIENGMKVYSLSDFQHGLMSVFIALVAAVIFVLLMKDKSPKTAN